ncbi:DUF6957 family protein [Marinobacter nauticus]|jgi:hypothetical protein|uniref:DUF6957 family protein n=1 Tax=Marinobacter nauticus TaxID=2743 RepID=UPI00241CA55B|nr:hypothetical protein [Marinobacter nauticus]
MKMADTIIKDWFLVCLEYENNIVAQVLWGLVVKDNKGRWQPEDYVCTSKVIKHLADGVFLTKNSRYECSGKGRVVTLEAEAIFELRSGISPEEYLTLKGLKERGFQTD